MIEIFDDIRKLYNFSAPCPELTDFIEFFSESSIEKTSLHTFNNSFTVKMFPSWTPTFWINLGAPYQIETNRVSYSISQLDDVLILRDSTVTRHNQPSDYIFTVKFFPGGLERILGISQTKFIGKVVSLRDIIPASLIHEIKAADSFKQRMEILETFFLLYYSKQKAKDHYLKMVSDSVHTFNAGNMQYNTSETAEKMFISSKTITRYFNNIVGISPKKYFSILRARNALTAFVKTKKTFNPGNYGYYDMSHFYRNIAGFIGERIADHE